MADLGPLLWEAATIMATGMVVVFLFLSILIYLVQLLAKIAPKETPDAPAPRQPSPVAVNHDGVQPEVVAAISAAVHRYRGQKA
ncbi:oxaloacetate decarboxylase subunit gamma [Photobacterium rosenbergii]|uniref:oxaloacetate decarboxylase subunit gamma n=1 Tax=Photobacterium rosenbergii TaxID=294936 RepID=UPI001C9A05B8|nr:oxaloacetate decarboxylase subunit gamma [Photobacterium rosenbergii]MBY5947459.1 oxaloacetate decarboxylase subunit gamma [Photobacterium rosenbergii]